VHGDFHLANVLFSLSGPRLAAIVDWEMATIGDPLLDLAWLLATWPSDDGQTQALVPVAPWAGFPTRGELIATYGEASSRDLAALPWFEVLACYKLGIVLEGTYARACAGQADRHIGERLHAVALSLLDRARTLVAQH
jgi:aminoglycoside phosphotransferase (APT) family kinase protein